MVSITILFSAMRDWLAPRTLWPLMLLTALLATLPALVLQARADELPTGVFSLTPPGKPVSEAILTSPLVAGVTIRWPWQKVEPVEGVYDWSYLDQEITRVADTGKMVLLRIPSGGKSTPQWVFDAGVQTFSFVDPVSNQPLTIPLWWDPIFLAKKKNFISAAGQHFADHPNVVLVSSSCANTTSDDWAVPTSSTDVQNLLALGYTSQKLINACKGIIDATRAAFPNQVTLMAVSRGIKGLDPNADYVATKVVNYAMTRYPGLFVAQKNSLSARTLDPWTSSHLQGWKVLYDNRPMVAGQMVWYVTDDPTCRMNGKITPCDPVQVLRQAVIIGSHYEMLYQEIYQQDIVNPALAGVINEAAHLLGQ